MLVGAFTLNREESLLEYATSKSIETAEIPLEEGWSKLKDHGIRVLSDVLCGEHSQKIPFGNKVYVSLYTISYRMCSNTGTLDHSKALYERASEEIRLFLLSVLKPEVSDLDLIPSDDEILTRFAHNWSNFKIFIKWMQRLFGHLDNGYVADSSTPTITSVGLKSFYDVIFSSSKLRVLESIMNVMDRERDGHGVDAEILAGCIDVFVSMGYTKSDDLTSVKAMALSAPDLSTYQTEFEQMLLKRTLAYYTKISTQLLAVKDSSTYLRLVEHTLEAEADRATKYLHLSSHPKMMSACKLALLQRHQVTLIEHEQSGVVAMLKQRKRNELGRLFRLFKHLPGGMLPVMSAVKKYVLMQGREILSDYSNQRLQNRKGTQSNPETIKKLIAMYTEMRHVVDEIFEGESQLQAAVREVMLEVVNSDLNNTSSVVELLVIYTDHVLSGRIKLLESEVELALSHAAELFTFLSDKDLFAETYRRRLSKRLLSNRVLPIHMERVMVSKLKMQQGAPFTAKLEGMINDYSLCQDVERLWRTSVRDSSSNNLAASGAHQLDFSVKVLTQGFWPSQTHHEVRLPDKMSAAKSMFEEWYRKQYNHRLLTWMYSLGEVIVRGTINDRIYDISVSPLQAALLLIFNNTSQPASFQRIQEELGLNEAVGKRVLHSLACGKYRVLLKSGRDRDISVRTDHFQINGDFSTRFRRFSVQMPSAEDESKPRMDREIEQQRRFSIDATIVRIMKSRKRMSHQELVGEVTHHVSSFDPDVKHVRQRIECLLEREYLNRDDHDPSYYTYIP
mmetsp:Transcript_3322/g.8546  ORF Transcript_3322/g.8546 Transcript_3322/m.8546 type:complete len:790 (-) Transcript_3322:177-2546(-)|eukprot:CAMPEP_0197414906 /NCGR_PEP_ID=MMETSP1170-20131217/1538_1 /TAXON_ID=54406 /ORGANISM="Sarcinochrysis sp, Strain CCMP770" /LENGTH=789 /DNA_ID=CAMNT_0042941663 /DNA_START=85 /DNA_END=2454 /DNA_ORIENTATION=+